MAAAIPELIADAHCQIAEGPVWHPDEGCLYWTDIPAGRIHRYDPARGTSLVVYEGEPVGGMTVQADSALLLLGAGGSVRTWRNGTVERVILPGIPGEQHTRFNDVIADPHGRVIAGTMAERDAEGQVVRFGRLYSIGPDGSYQVLLDGMGSPNGMAFTGDQRALYQTESIPGVQSIFRFAYDIGTGTIRDRQLVLQTPLDLRDGRPDGMTLDIEGCLWSARWDGGMVVRLNPDGSERERYPLPVARVTSVAFGGPDLRDLYVTTALGDDPDEHKRGAGGIFHLRTGTGGRPEFRSRVGIGRDGERS